MIYRDRHNSSQIEEKLKEGDEKYRDLFESVNDVILFIDEEGNIFDINRRGEELTGLSHEELIKRNVFKDLVIPEDRESLKKVMCNLLRGESQVYEVQWKVKDGNILAFEGISYPYLLEDDRLISTRIILRDITKRKTAEEELIKVYDELKEAHQNVVQLEKLAALGSFASGIAHEAKNLLGIILMGLEFMERKLEKKPFKADVDIKIAMEKIKGSIFKADKILKSLLHFAMPSEHKLEKVKPDDLIKDTISFLKYNVSIKNIKMKYQFCRKEMYVEIDRNQMQQVISNLYINAVEAIHNCGKITIKVYRAMIPEISPDKQFCVIEIIDTGVGISEENMSKIFKPFFTTKSRENGIGLGLFITKMLVNNNNGDVRLVSKQGIGTCAKIILPIARV